MRIFQPIISGSLTQSGSAVISGSLTVTNGITGSLYGTSSWALTASYAPNLTISGSINSVDYIDFNTGSAEPAWKNGRMFWNDVEGALSIYNSEADVTLQVGQENWTRVFNDTGAAIANGAPVRIIGTHGDHPEIVLAQSIQVSGSTNLVNQVLGLATHTIEDGTFGYVTTQGLVRGLNTNAYTDGATLYVSSSAGLLTSTVPSAPYEIIPVAQVVKAGPGTSGITYVAVQQPLDFSDLSSVQVAGRYVDGDLWSYNGPQKRWEHKKQLSGSYAITGSLTATSFTGSLYGTSSWAVNATTASLVNGNVNVTTATIGNTVYATISTSAGAGTTSIYSVPNSTYSSIFVDYSVNEGTTNARAGTIQVISVGSNLNFTETTTMDIGNTNDISWYIYLSGADINFEIINAAGASWTIKFSSRQM